MMTRYGKSYCYGSSEGEHCHCDYCKCKLNNQHIHIFRHTSVSSTYPVTSIRYLYFYLKAGTFGSCLIFFLLQLNSSQEQLCVTQSCRNPGVSCRTILGNREEILIFEEIFISDLFVCRSVRRSAIVSDFNFVSINQG